MKVVSRVFFFLCLFALMVVLSSKIFFLDYACAEWSDDPSVNTPVCINTDKQAAPPVLTSDGSGGVIIAWTDNRSGSLNIYAQRIDASGTPQWAVDGVAVCTDSGNQYNIAIASDGLGGAIIAWNDMDKNEKLYAQHINEFGTPQWGVDGVDVCNNRNYQYQPKIISDGSGGAIIAWNGSRDGSRNIYAQRINASGILQWHVDSVTVCTITGYISNYVLLGDGSGGVIIAWEDFRISDNGDIYAQRIDASGIPQWTANGFAVCTAAQNQRKPVMISDGSDGVIIAWVDNRNNNEGDIYAQHLNTSGIPQWVVDGVAVSTANGYENKPEITSDGSGGAIIAWQNSKGPGTVDIYAQRINMSGISQWNDDGVVVCNANYFQHDPVITNDGLGSVIIAWLDRRISNENDIYAQRINSFGTTQWTDNGIAICTASQMQQYLSITNDGAGGAIFAWRDDRNGNPDIYAQQINKDGQLGVILDDFQPDDVNNDDTNGGDNGGGSGGCFISNLF